MKTNSLFLIPAMVLLSMNAGGEESVNIHLKSGVVEVFPAAEVEKVSFGPSQAKEDIACFSFDGNPFDEIETIGVVNASRITYAPGAHGQAAEFDGTESQIRLVSGALLPAGGADRTIAFWVKPERVGHGDRIMSSGKWAVGNAFDVDFAYGGHLGVVTHTGNCYSSAVIDTGRWTHVGIVVDGTALRVYLDGHLDSTHALSGFNTVNTVTWRIGSPLPDRDITSHFQGLLDELGIYGRALSEAEMAGLAEAPEGLSGLESDPEKSGSYAQSTIQESR